MRHWDCPHECSDDDCYKCGLHGYQFSCDGCEDYDKYLEQIKKQKGDNENE